MSQRTRTRDAAAPGVPATLAAQLARHAARTPDAPALVYGEWRLSYRDLNAAANRLARRLMALGVGREVRVGLLLDRGPDLLVAMLAVMKAGGAYVPFDPHWPRERLARMDAMAMPRVVITRAALRGLLSVTDRVLVDLDRHQSLIGAEECTDPDVRIDAGQPCYLMFTSGSTGLPKGVVITHGNLAGLFPPIQALLALGPGDVWTWFHSASFGFSVWEIWGALLHGGCLVIVPEHIRRDPVALGELLVDEQVTVFSQTPSGFRRLLDVEGFHQAVGRSRLRWLALSGEALRAEDLAGWIDRHGDAGPRLVSSYAITETAGQVTLRVHAAADLASDAGPRNLGVPLPGRHARVLDASGRPQAAGEGGELWIGGDCVSPGYLDEPDLTRQRFTELALPELGVVRGYRSGDRVRQRPDGALEYLGRADEQIKYRGHRLEPGDIEAALRSHPQVQDAAVALRTDPAGESRLTGFVVGRGPEAEAPVGGGLEFWPSLGAYGVYDELLYGLMNAEPARLAAYRAAFAATVPGRVVLDIGTGADALLARLCVEAGARHVYAVEVLESAAARAADLVRTLGLAERITVLAGDIATLTLPEPVEVCTQGIIGNIGSADGIAAIWNAARRNFAPDCVAVPSRCVTRIAALELPAGAGEAARFPPLAAGYAAQLFEVLGGGFDLRLAVRHVDPASLLTAPADFEVLAFSGQLPEAHQGRAALAVQRDGLFHGCLLWTVVTTIAGQEVDYLREQSAWLPVYFPLSDDGLPVRAGDVLELSWRAGPESDPCHPDYSLEVVCSAPGRGFRRHYLTRHRETQRGSTRLHRELLASVETRAGQLSVTALRAWLADRLPEHMIPQSWVFLPELPLTPGGKLDREALPAPGRERPALAVPLLAPRTAAEVALARLWAEALRLAAIGVADDFFDLGGDSITAVRLTTATQRWLDAAVPLAALFDAPTVAAMARYLEARYGAALAKALGRSVAATPGALPEGPAPLTAAQQSLWFLDQLYPGDTSASEQFVLRLEGPLDEAALSRAWAGLLARHAILRATFHADGDGARQQVGAATELPPARALTEDVAAWRAAAEAALARPFDLGSGPLLRPELYRCRPDLHLLVVTAHHIVADGLSVPLIRATLADLYGRELGGGESAPPADGPDYAAYARAAASRPAREEAAALDHWQACLAGLPPPPLAALVAPASPARRSRRLALELPVALADGLRRLAQAESATPFMVLSAAFRLLVARLTGEQDLLIGTPMTLRDRAEWGELVGCLVNPVALRHRIDPGAGFRSLLRGERQVVLQALEHRHVAFSRVVEAVSPARELHQHPLFQILFSYEPEPVASVSAAGVAFGLIQLPADRASYFDLECSVRDGGEGTPLRGHLAWSSGVLEDWVAARLPGTFLTLLADLVARPELPVGQLNLLPAGERALVLDAWNDTAAPADGTLTLHQCFLEQALRTPDAPALRTTDAVLSYGELAARSARLARQLLARGAVPGDRVGIALPRSPELVLAVLAAFRAGLTVVPLDPGFPDARLRLMAANAQLRLLLVPGGADGAGLPARLGLPAGLAVPVALAGTEGSTPPLPATEALPCVAGEAPALILYTSGSTGEPKGAITLHHAAVHRCRWMWRAHGFGPSDVFALRTTLNFIDVLWEIFGALGHGVPLAIVPDEVATDALRLPAALQALGVTHLVLVPSLLRAVLEAVEADPERRPPLTSCISSGEPLEPALVHRFRRCFPGARLLNTWGTSEIWDATCYDTAELPAAAARVPIGRPIANARVYVLDRQGEALPVGIPGELWVGGLGVGPGYWRNPKLTAKRFVAAPAGPGPRAGRLYRSGDRVRFLADGTLECLGRLDDQRKLRGLRVEPGEVEAVLAGHAAVRAAIVSLAGEGLKARLRAGVVLQDAAAVGQRELGATLRAHLAAQLPAHLVPAEFVVLDSLPLTPSGKRDRQRFIAEDCGHLLAADPTVPADRLAPRTATEQRLAGLWCEVLQQATVGVHDDFFALGGHSLLAVRLTTRIRSHFGVELALRDFFAAPSIAALATLLDAPAPASRAAVPALVPVGREGPLPLSFGQERLWVLDQLDPASPAYNVAWTLRLEGLLDQAALRQALEYLVARHEPLRACFPAVAGRPTQVIGAPSPVTLATHDLEDMDEPGRQAWLVAFARRPFDLGRGPLLRVALLKLGPRRHGLALVVHHAVTDATSNHILFEELAAAYEACARGCAPALPPLAIQYADFAAWERRSCTDEQLAGELAWWREALAGAPPALELPTDRPRPAEQRFAGAWVRRRLTPANAEQLRRFARDQQGTLFDLLLAAFQVLLHRVSGATDILVGTPVEGRLAAPVERLVGLFINTLVMRGDLRGDPGFLDLLARNRATARAAQAHQSLPFERLVEALAPERSLSRSPVFQVMFNLIRLPARHRRAGEVDFHLDRLVDLGVASFDLTLTAGEHADGLDLIFEYATDLYAASTMEGLASGYVNLLAAILADPQRPISRLSLLDAEMRAKLAAAGNPPTTIAGGDPVHQVIAGLAARDPDRPAVTLGGRSLCYGELEARANQLAHHLRAQGVLPGSRVGLCLPRSPEAIVAWLACLKAGCAYVSLDPEYPVARLEVMAQDAELAALLVSGEAGAALRGLAPRCVDLAADAARIAAGPNDVPAIPVSADDLAYVIYTSGTTGLPKGVMVTHGNLASMWQAWQDAYDLEPGEAHLQMANAAFDVFTGDVVRALCSGSHLVICPREQLLDPPALFALLRDRQVRVAEFVPAVIRLLLDHLEQAGLALPPLRLLVVGSDTWHAGDLGRLRRVCAPGTRIINSYGVAEATIDSAWHDTTPVGAGAGAASAATLPSTNPHGVAAEAAPHQPHSRLKPLLPATPVVPIGRPFANSCIYLLDAHGEPVLPGMPGELCIGGHGVVRGYLGQPGLTAQRFGADPFRPGMRLYRTGDQARRLADGTLELLGRMDQQRKLRGFRIEPGEIEAVLATHPAVDAAVVGLGAPSGGESRLVAWIVYREPGGLAGDLRDWLQGRLPAHLVPAVFLALPALPLTPNGKVDRAALAASVLEPEPATGSVPGRTPLEELLCGLFAEVLGLPAFGVHEDFFARGGHSLLATRLVARIRAALAAELPLRAVFESPTPAGVARYIAAGANGMPALPAALPRRPAGLALLPLSPPQQRLWFLHQLEPASTAYHLHWTLRLAGELDAVALEAAVNDLVARHEALRTCFVVAAGTPWQQVEPRLSRTVGLEDYSEGALHRCLTVPFDLARGPLLRVALLREADDAHVLVVVLHHIVADGWSLAVLGRELGLLYGARRAGRPAGLAALPVQYGDYALWLAGRLGSDEMDGQLRYWQGQLAGLPPRLPLPRDQVGGDAAAASAWLTRTLPAACLMPLKELARGEGATLFMVLLAGFAVVLGRRAGTDDVAVGTPVAGRGRTELEGLIGFFVNTLVLRTDLSGDPTFRELLARVKAMALAAYAHAELPFEKLVEVLNPPRSLAHGPLVQVQIVLHNQPRAELCFPGVNAEPLPVASTDAKFDLSLHLAEASGGLDLTLSWRADRYGRERMAALLDAYADVLRAVATQPALRLSSLCPPKELQPRRQPRGAAPKGPRDPSPAELPARVAPAPPGESRPEPCAAREGELTDEVEAVLQSIWCELLRQDTVGVDEDFFAVGGHSLLATRLVARISDQLNVELPLLRVFQTPSIRGLARAVCAAPAAGTRPAHAPIPRLPRRPGG